MRVRATFQCIWLEHHETRTKATGGGKHKKHKPGAYEMKTRRNKHVPFVDILVLFLVLVCFFVQKHEKEHEKRQSTAFKSHGPCKVVRFFFFTLNLEIHVVSDLGHVKCMSEK